MLQPTHLKALIFGMALIINISIHSQKVGMNCGTAASSTIQSMRFWGSYCLTFVIGWTNTGSMVTDSMESLPWFTIIMESATDLQATTTNTSITIWRRMPWSISCWLTTWWKNWTHTASRLLKMSQGSQVSAGHWQMEALVLTIGSPWPYQTCGSSWLRKNEMKIGMLDKSSISWRGEDGRKSVSAMQRVTIRHSLAIRHWQCGYSIDKFTKTCLCCLKRLQPFSEEWPSTKWSGWSQSA